MGSSINKVVLIGNLGARPELRYTAAGTPVCNLSVATNHRFKDREGQYQEKTSWHKVVSWGKQAEACSRYLDRGKMVYVEGRLDNQTYNDRDGVQRMKTEIVSSRVVFLGSGRNADAASESGEPDRESRSIIDHGDGEPGSPGNGAGVESAVSERLPF